MKESTKYLIRDAGIGVVSGLLVALGGAIKDSPYEGFEWQKFVRSPAIGAVEAPIIGRAFKEPHPVLIGLATVACERLTVETYKLARAKAGQYMPGKFEHGEWGISKKMTASSKHNFGTKDYAHLMQVLGRR